MCHAESAFATLTYAGSAFSLIPSDLKAFVKALPKAVGRPVRYFAVGEYGEQTMRPHYHLMLFGFSFLERERVEDCWRYGHTQVVPYSETLAQYIAGYVSKKMTAKDDERLEGRFPEFARMSNRPGLGAEAMKRLARDLTSSEANARALANGIDVPGEVRVAGKLYPVGRYLKGKLREGVGWDNRQPREAALVLQAKAESLTVQERQEREVRREHSYESARKRIEIKNTKRRL